MPAIVPSSVFGKKSPSNRITMGAIGVGNQGRGDMGNFIRKEKSGKTQMVAVCDVWKPYRDAAKKKVDKKYHNKDCKTYNDFRELLDRGDIDAIVTATPDHWHAIIGIEAAKRGIHVYSEKPLTRTIREGRAICDAVEQYGIVWQTGSQQRSQSQFHRACELVRNGRIGKLIKTEVGLSSGKEEGIMPAKPVPQGLDWDLWLGPAPWRPYHDFCDGKPGDKRFYCHYYWRFIRDFAAGQLTNWGAHHIDIAQWGLGYERSGPVEIQGKGSFPEKGIFNTPLEFNATCKFANHEIMHVGSGKSAGFKKGAKWYGEKGWIQVDRKRLEASDPNILKEVIGPNEIHLYKSTSHFDNFIDCIKNHSETVAPAEIGHRSCSTGLLIEIALLTNRKIKWDPDKEEIIDDPAANALLGRANRSPWVL